MKNTESKYMENLRNKAAAHDEAMREALKNGDFESAYIHAKNAADMEAILHYHTHHFPKC
jgi:HEPN domain-containing protein